MHTIKTVSRISGVPELTIRAWEKRYEAFKPQRTESNRRLYTDSDLDKLTLLGQLTQEGHRIGDIAGHSLEQLEQLRVIGGPDIPKKNMQSEFIGLIDECIQAIREYDSPKLHKLLGTVLVEKPVIEVIEQIIIPLIEKIGNMWNDGEMRVAQEHFASSAIKFFLARISTSYSASNSSPAIVIAAPEGQFHELEAVLASIIASSEGWRTIYLGPGLPVEEIASAAIQLHSRCVHLSLVYPADDGALLLQIPRLRSLLGEDAFIIASGRAARGYHSALLGIRAIVTSSARQYRQTLSVIRKKITNMPVHSQADKTEAI
ncbi:MAG: MerR family transcriptional regulator [Ignavibacteria bacterium]|nr:MerR family transcriptional regulator [Ignavibacteria bacterium]